MSEKLCYIDGSWAYFTTQPLDKQWGDDWNDAPYEHNAGEPYGPRAERGEDWEITAVAWQGPFQTPADLAGSNSRYSVEQINRGDIAWLTPDSFGAPNAKPIHAGVSFAEFKALLAAAGGRVYAWCE